MGRFVDGCLYLLLMASLFACYFVVVLFVYIFYIIILTTSCALFLLQYPNTKLQQTNLHQLQHKHKDELSSPIIRRE